VANALANAIDPIEMALADAITKASTAGEWATVARLAGEMEARRLAHAGNVVALAGKARQRVS
jgi:thiazole synthase ThiGH ThiG subunit